MIGADQPWARGVDCLRQPIDSTEMHRQTNGKLFIEKEKGSVLDIGHLKVERVSPRIVTIHSSSWVGVPPTGPQQLALDLLELPTGPALRPADRLCHSSVVATVIPENLLTAVATRHDVIERSRVLNSNRPGHYGLTLRPQPIGVNPRVS